MVVVMSRGCIIGSVAVAMMSLFVGCGGSDDNDALRDAVLSCIANGGGDVGDGADVGIAGGRAMAVIGPVEASDALISSCLDLANK
jgi:hypothetical protein